MSLKILLKRGLDSERQTVIFDMGEPVFCTDTQQLWIGDGSTMGGVPLIDATKFYNQQRVWFDLNGTPVNGDIYSIILGGVNFDFTVSANETIDQIAIGLASLISADPNYQATAVGNSLDVNCIYSGSEFSVATSTTDVGGYIYYDIYVLATGKTADTVAGIEVSATAKRNRIPVSDWNGKIDVNYLPDTQIIDPAATPAVGDSLSWDGTKWVPMTTLNGGTF